jgi:hypothetical protein
VREGVGRLRIPVFHEHRSVLPAAEIVHPSVAGDIDPYSIVGEFITVRVTGADEYDLIAEIVEI